jgi:hypothetical protein
VGHHSDGVAWLDTIGMVSHTNWHITVFVGVRARVACDKCLPS